MASTIRHEGRDYAISDLSPEAQHAARAIEHCEALAVETANMIALLTKARNAYISDLKYEIIQGKTGVDLSSLISGD